MVFVMYFFMELMEILSLCVILLYVRLFSCESRNVLCVLLFSLFSMLLRSCRVLSWFLCFLGEGVFFFGISVSIFRYVFFSVFW